MSLEKLDGRLRRAIALESLIARHSEVKRDPADDGPEVAIIRQVLDRSEKWYHDRLPAATRERFNEEDRILAAEAEFLRKVGL